MCLLVSSLLWSAVVLVALIIALWFWLKPTRVTCPKGKMISVIKEIGGEERVVRSITGGELLIFARLQKYNIVDLKPFYVEIFSAGGFRDRNGPLNVNIEVAVVVGDSAHEHHLAAHTKNVEKDVGREEYIRQVLHDELRDLLILESIDDVDHNRFRRDLEKKLNKAIHGHGFIIKEFVHCVIRRQHE